MAALSADILRNHAVHDPLWIPLGVKADEKIYVHALVCTDSNGLAVAGTDSANLTFQGVAWTGLDNTGGANGVTTGTSNNFNWERYVQIDRVGDWEFAVSAGTPKPGGTAYLVNDNTVSANATTNSIAVGKFVRPGNEGGWMVDISRR